VNPMRKRDEQLPNPKPVRNLPVQRLIWTAELVERFWTGHAQTRLTEYDFARQGGKSLIIAVQHHLPKDGRILDFGAGNGELAELLLERGYQVAAYEPSRGRANHLLSRLGGRAGFLGVVKPESREQFDAVLMVEVIEHILNEEFDRTLRRVREMLKDEGTLIVTTPNNEDLELGMAYCPVSNILFHRWQHVRAFTAESLSMVLSQYGISPIVVHCLDFRPDLYVPYDHHWGGERFDPVFPSQLVAIRNNVSVHIGNESNLLYIGRKAPLKT
jgi:2-polyprenyl-3-methyl-5-hydroxy-6-metoxy-1,4-benzoquinol methylase